LSYKKLKINGFALQDDKLAFTKTTATQALRCTVLYLSDNFTHLRVNEMNNKCMARMKICIVLRTKLKGSLEN
jgi:hypothetical protein